MTSERRDNNNSIISIMTYKQAMPCHTCHCEELSSWRRRRSNLGIAAFRHSLPYKVAAWLLILIFSFQTATYGADQDTLRQIRDAETRIGAVEHSLGSAEGAQAEPDSIKKIPSRARKSQAGKAYIWLVLALTACFMCYSGRPALAKQLIIMPLIFEIVLRKIFFKKVLMRVFNHSVFSHRIFKNKVLWSIFTSAYILAIAGHINACSLNVVNFPVLWFCLEVILASIYARTNNLAWSVAAQSVSGIAAPVVNCSRFLLYTIPGYSAFLAIALITAFILLPKSKEDTKAFTESLQTPESLFGMIERRQAHIIDEKLKGWCEDKVFVMDKRVKRVRGLRVVNVADINATEDFALLESVKTSFGEWLSYKRAVRHKNIPRSFLFSQDWVNIKGYLALSGSNEVEGFIHHDLDTPELTALEIAPWNRSDIVDSVRFEGLGWQLLTFWMKRVTRGGKAVTIFAVDPRLKKMLIRTGIGIKERYTSKDAEKLIASQRKIILRLIARYGLEPEEPKSSTEASPGSPRRSTNRTLAEFLTDKTQGVSEHKQPSYIIHYLEKSSLPEWLKIGIKTVASPWVVPHELGNLMQAVLTHREDELEFEYKDLFSGLYYAGRAPPCIGGIWANLLMALASFAIPYDPFYIFGLTQLVFVIIEIAFTATERFPIYSPEVTSHTVTGEHKPFLRKNDKAEGMLEGLMIVEQRESEDRYIDVPIVTSWSKGRLLGVFDGHCGTEVAEGLRAGFADRFSEKLEEHPNNEREALIRTVESFAYDYRRTPAGSGLSVLYIPEGSLIAYAAVVGTSPIIWRGKQGRLKISPRHDLDNKQEAARIDERIDVVIRNTDPKERTYVIKNHRIERYEGENKIFISGLSDTRSIGSSILGEIITWEPDIFTIPLDYPAVLVATDGLFSYISREDTKGIFPMAEAERFLKMAEEGHSAEALVNASLSLGSRDDITTITIKNNKDAASTPPATKSISILSTCLLAGLFIGALVCIYLIPGLSGTERAGTMLFLPLLGATLRRLDASVSTSHQHSLQASEAKVTAKSKFSIQSGATYGTLRHRDLTIGPNPFKVIKFKEGPHCRRFEIWVQESPNAPYTRRYTVAVDPDTGRPLGIEDGRGEPSYDKKQYQLFDVLRATGQLPHENTTLEDIPLPSSDKLTLLGVTYSGLKEYRDQFETYGFGKDTPVIFRREMKHVRKRGDKGVMLREATSIYVKRPGNTERALNSITLNAHGRPEGITPKEDGSYDIMDVLRSQWEPIVLPIKRSGNRYIFRLDRKRVIDATKYINIERVRQEGAFSNIKVARRERPVTRIPSIQIWDGEYRPFEKKRATTTVDLNDDGSIVGIDKDKRDLDLWDILCIQGKEEDPPLTADWYPTDKDDFVRVGLFSSITVDTYFEYLNEALGVEGLTGLRLDIREDQLVTSGIMAGNTIKEFHRFALDEHGLIKDRVGIYPRQVTVMPLLEVQPNTPIAGGKVKVELFKYRFGSYMEALNDYLEREGLLPLDKSGQCLRLSLPDVRITREADRHGKIILQVREQTAGMDMGEVYDSIVIDEEGFPEDIERDIEERSVDFLEVLRRQDYSAFDRYPQIKYAHKNTSSVNVSKAEYDNPNHYFTYSERLFDGIGITGIQRLAFERRRDRMDIVACFKDSEAEDAVEREVYVDSINLNEDGYPTEMRDKKRGTKVMSIAPLLIRQGRARELFIMDKSQDDRYGYCYTYMRKVRQRKQRIVLKTRGSFNGRFAPSQLRIVQYAGTAVPRRIEIRKRTRGDFKNEEVLGIIYVDENVCPLTLGQDAASLPKYHYHIDELLTMQTRDNAEISRWENLTLLLIKMLLREGKHKRARRIISLYEKYVGPDDRLRELTRELYNRERLLRDGVDLVELERLTRLPNRFKAKYPPDYYKHGEPQPLALKVAQYLDYEGPPACKRMVELALLRFFNSIPEEAMYQPLKGKVPKIEKDILTGLLTATTVFFRNTGHLKTLTPLGEVVLGARIQCGDESANAKFSEANYRLVTKIAKEYRWSGLPLIQLVNAGIISLIERGKEGKKILELAGLAKAVTGYKPQLGYRFSPYAAKFIRQAITNEIFNNLGKIKVSKAVRRAALEFESACEAMGKDPLKEDASYLAGITPYRSERIKTFQLALRAIRAVSKDAPRRPGEGEEAEDRIEATLAQEEGPDPAMRESVKYLMKAIVPEALRILKGKWTKEVWDRNLVVWYMRVLPVLTAHAEGRKPAGFSLSQTLEEVNRVTTNRRLHLTTVKAVSRIARQEFWGTIKMVATARKEKAKAAKARRASRTVRDNSGFSQEEAEQRRRYLVSRGRKPTSRAIDLPRVVFESESREFLLAMLDNGDFQRSLLKAAGITSLSPTRRRHIANRIHDLALLRPAEVAQRLIAQMNTAWTAGNGHVGRAVADFVASEQGVYVVKALGEEGDAVVALADKVNAEFQPAGVGPASGMMSADQVIEHIPQVLTEATTVDDVETIHMWNPNAQAVIENTRRASSELPAVITSRGYEIRVNVNKTNPSSAEYEAIERYWKRLRETFPGANFKEDIITANGNGEDYLVRIDCNGIGHGSVSIDNPKALSTQHRLFSLMNIAFIASNIPDIENPQWSSDYIAFIKYINNQVYSLSHLDKHYLDPEEITLFSQATINKIRNIPIRLDPIDRLDLDLELELNRAIESLRAV